MKRDTIDFLETLLRVADDPDEEQRPLIGKSVYDFSNAFVAGAEAFIDGFRQHLIDTGVRPAVLASGERSFGGNVYLSLSGHGAGFFDDNDAAIADLHHVLQKWAGGLRFHELECELDIGKDGKIDLCILPGYLKEYRDKLFAVPE